MPCSTPANPTPSRDAPGGVNLASSFVRDVPPENSRPAQFIPRGFRLDGAFLNPWEAWAKREMVDEDRLIGVLRV